MLVNQGVELEHDRRALLNGDITPHLEGLLAVRDGGI
jgi:hypothetical protein